MNKTVVECGIELFVSDQEIAYTIIPESNHSSPVYGRRVRSIRSNVGVVTDDILAAQLEALYLGTVCLSSGYSTGLPCNVIPK